MKYPHHDDSVGYKLDRLLRRLDRWDSWRDEMDRRFDNLEPNPNRRYDQRTWYDDDDSDGDGARRRCNWERGPRPRNPNFGTRDSPQRDRYHREGRYHRGSCWDPPRYQQHRQHIGGYDQQFNRPATSRGYSDYGQPPLGPPSRGDPPDNRCPQTLQPTKSDRRVSHRTAPLSAIATHPPQQSSGFIDSGKQRGLPNIPSLKVCSPYPAAVSDYNEKWRIYRLQHFPLLAELNATLKENIDDENLVEDVPNNAAHNGGANLDVDVPIDESLEETVKTDNTPRQVLVGAYGEKIVDLSVPTHKELDMSSNQDLLKPDSNGNNHHNQANDLDHSYIFVTGADGLPDDTLDDKGVAIGGSSVPPPPEDSQYKKVGEFCEEAPHLIEGENGEVEPSNGHSHLVNYITCNHESSHENGQGVQVSVTDSGELNANKIESSLEAEVELVDSDGISESLAKVEGFHVSVADPQEGHTGKPGRVDKLFDLARNFSDKVGSPLLIFYGSEEGRRSSVRCVFDPGGVASPKLLISTLLFASWFPP